MAAGWRSEGLTKTTGCRRDGVTITTRGQKGVTVTRWTGCHDRTPRRKVIGGRRRGKEKSCGGIARGRGANGILIPLLINLAAATVDVSALWNLTVAVTRTLSTLQ